jgi:SpoVK/Ycf46/Vps4 family AAA+-type ATPase
MFIRAKCVLFEGPPGCGKTTSARIIASQAKVPLVYIPLEAIMSKYYGESESRLAQIFTVTNSSVMFLYFFLVCSQIR